jgi:hypothetical protein
MIFIALETNYAEDLATTKAPGMGLEPFYRVLGVIYYKI